MGDIALGCSIWRWMALPIERPALPGVQRWFESLARRPAYRQIVMLPLVLSTSAPPYPLGSPVLLGPLAGGFEPAREASHEHPLAHLEGEEEQHAEIGREQQFGKLLRGAVGHGHHAVFENQLHVRLEQHEQVDRVEAEQQKRQAHEDEREPGVPVEKIQPSLANELEHGGKRVARG